MGGRRSRRGTAETGAPPEAALAAHLGVPRAAGAAPGLSAGLRALQRFSRLPSLVTPALPEPDTAPNLLALAIFFSPSCLAQSTAPAARARLHGAGLRLACTEGSPQGDPNPGAGGKGGTGGTGVPGACPQPAPSSREHRPGRARAGAAGARSAPDRHTRRAEIF